MVYDTLNLENELGYTLYAANKENVKRYRSLLETTGLTFAQYLTMLVMWKREELTSKELGETLYFDSCMLSPLLKALEKMGYLTRRRSLRDERMLILTITDKGRALKKTMRKIPAQAEADIPLTEDEMQTLHTLLQKMMRP